MRTENIEALESRISAESEKLETLKEKRNFLDGRFNELSGKQGEAASRVEILAAKIKEHQEVLKATKKEIKDYHTIDPNEIDEDALRYNNNLKFRKLTSVRKNMIFLV